MLRGSYAPPRSATFALAPTPESVHAARCFALATMYGWRLAEVCDNLELVVSELITNALRHGQVAGETTPLRLSLIHRATHVLCAISDPSPATPTPRDQDLDDLSDLEPGGLGLHIVESLSRAWGWSPMTPTGKIVWAALPTTD
ncbi:ATP-binding protein [Bailinhaonella thermotolerans]|uniref:ATP-binding protein n=1 Tax=Bailinhaonella thermotolerans TaxID=1070861 RepID=A0A3A4A4W3_9ACTN|nr:ATP-binding protein [Bailinhaonella thermotolerans]